MRVAGECEGERPTGGVERRHNRLEEAALCRNVASTAERETLKTRCNKACAVETSMCSSEEAPPQPTSEVANSGESTIWS